MRVTRRLIAVAAVVLVAGSTTVGQSEDRWKDFRFLLGEWAGVGKGDAGEGAGTFSFELGLDGNVLIRKSHSTYPATKDRPAFAHDDLMVIYREGGRMRATYFDNEDHVIHYTVSVSAEPPALTFVSEAAPDAPRFRFRYTSLGKDRVNGRFEIAPRGKPNAFSLYIEGDARRVR
jgi:hypothetical protein